MSTSSCEELRLAAFEAVAKSWRDAGLVYSVAHGLDEYPARLGRDVDVVVHPRRGRCALAMAAEVLHESGWECTVPPATFGWRLLAWKERDWGSGLEIHVLEGLTWRGVSLVEGVVPEGRIGPFSVDWSVAWTKAVMMPALAGELGRAVDNHAALKRLGAVYETIPSRLCPRGSIASVRSLFGSLEREDVGELAEVVRTLRHHMLRCALTEQPRFLLSLLTRTLVRPIRQWATTAAPIVALLGPDGSGKSTLATGLRKSPGLFVRVVVRHWRPGLLPALGRVAGTAPTAQIPRAPRRRAGRFTCLRAAYYALDFVVGRALLDRPLTGRQMLLVYDRHAIDMALDSLRYGMKPGWCSRLAAWVAPRPHLQIAIVAEPAIVRRRKSELSSESVKAYNTKLLRLYEIGRLDKIVDGRMSPGAMVREVRLTIIAFMLQSGKKRLHRLLSAHKSQLCDCGHQNKLFRLLS